MRRCVRAMSFGFVALLSASCIASEPPDAYRDTTARARAADSAGGEAVSANVTGAMNDAPDDTDQSAEVRGSGPVELSVEQAMLLALRRNRSLTVQALQTEVTGAYEAIERGAFDPELFARGNYGSRSESQTTDVTGDQFSVTSDADALAVGVRQRLPTGTAVELAASNERSASSRRPEQYEARVGLTVTQALLRGFGPAANLARVRVAEAETLASVWELRGFTEALLADAESAYWRHVLAQRTIGIVEGSLAVANQQLAEVAQFVAVGRLAPIDLAVLEGEVARRNQDLIDARSALEVARLRLIRLLGLSARELAERAVVTSSEPQTALEAIDDLPQRLQLALQLRGDLNEARQRIEQQDLQTQMTRNGLLPRLELFITLGKSGYASSFGDAAENITGENYDFAAGIELSYALGNRAASGRFAIAQAAKWQAEAAVANLEDLVELDVRTAAIEVERARQQIAASAVTRGLRDQSVTAQLERLRVGTGTSLELAQSQRDLVTSELGEVAAMVAYRLALVELYRAEGSLLERRGLSVPNDR